MKSHLCFPTAVTLDSLKMPSLSIYRTIDVSSDKNNFPTLLFQGYCNVFRSGIQALSQLTFTWSKSKIETLEEGVQYVQR